MLEDLPAPTLEELALYLSFVSPSQSVLDLSVHSVFLVSAFLQFSFRGMVTHSPESRKIDYGVDLLKVFKDCLSNNLQI